MKRKKEKTQLPHTTVTGDWMYCTLRVRPDEMKAWRAMAAVDDRTLSYWVRQHLNKAVAGAKNGGSHEPGKTLETVSADRPDGDAIG